MRTIRQLLRRELSLLMGLAVLVAIGVATWSLIQVMNFEWKHRVASVNAFLGEDVRDAILDATGLGRDVSTLHASGLLDYQQPERVAQSLAQLLENSRFASAIVLARPDGEAFLAERLKGSSVLEGRHIRPSRAGNLATPLWPPSAQSFGSSPFALTFQKRHWYLRALEARTPIWSHGEQGKHLPQKDLTFAVPLFDANGALEVVIGVDLRFPDLATWLQSALPTPGSRVLLLDLAADPLILPGTGHPTRFSLDSIQALLKADERTPERLLIGGRRWIGSRTRIGETQGMDLHLVILVPESELFRQAPLILGALLLWVLSMIGLFLVATSRTARRLVRPLERLALNPDAPPPTSTTDIVEVHALEEAMREAREQHIREQELQRRLQQTQRMETLGALTSGVAHDLNNQLMAIQGQIELGRMGLPDALPSQAHFQAAQDAVQRGAGILKSLLTYGRLHTAGVTSLDLNQVVGRTAALLDRLLGKHIELRLCLDSGPLTILMDEIQLEQLLLNLAINAQDAMPKGGTLTLSTEAQGERVLLAVADTGSGIPDDIRDRIFEPFFTTKAVGQGTGLGLSMVQGITQAHGASVEVDSEPGTGTRFRIHFPRHHG